MGPDVRIQHERAKFRQNYKYPGIEINSPIMDILKSEKFPYGKSARRAVPPCQLDDRIASTRLNAKKKQVRGRPNGKLYGARWAKVGAHGVHENADIESEMKNFADEYATLGCPGDRVPYINISEGIS